MKPWNWDWLLNDSLLHKLLWFSHILISRFPSSYCRFLLFCPYVRVLHQENHLVSNCDETWLVQTMQDLKSSTWFFFPTQRKSTISPLCLGSFPWSHASTKTSTRFLSSTAPWPSACITSGCVSTDPAAERSRDPQPHSTPNSKTGRANCYLKQVPVQD